jgi:outer membrane protein
MKKMMLAATLGIACYGNVFADEPGDTWIVKVGAHVVDPKSNNGTIAAGAYKVDVGSGTEATITGEYLFAPNWGVELLAALPFSHDIKLNGAKAATVKELPPTASVQYHFNASGVVSPFIGAGVNYTLFFNEHEKGPLTGTNLSLSNSWGPALHAGIDFNIDRNWLITVDARWIGISTDVKVNGTKLGSVDIDPLVYGFAIGYRF